jgi:hypothetical protein
MAKVDAGTTRVGTGAGLTSGVRDTPTHIHIHIIMQAHTCHACTWAQTHRQIHMHMHMHTDIDTGTGTGT